MSFKILLLPPDVDESWPEKIGRAVPGAVAKAFRDPMPVTEIEDRRRTGRFRPSSSPGRGSFAGSAPPVPAWAAPGSTTRSCRATSS